jgi:VWFA-related protein
MRSAVLIAATALFGVASQDARPPQPTFRSGVDLLTIEVSVRGAKGDPIADLQPSDFVVTVDGKPRKVLFARLFQSTPVSVVVGGAPTVPRHVTNLEATPGRVVVFAVDTDSIRSGQGKPLLDNITRMLDQLGPADAVALITLPSGGVDLTRDHARVREAIANLNGTQPSAQYNVGGRASGGGFTLSWEEVVAFERNQRAITSQAIARECRPTEQKNQAGLNCPDEVAQQAKQMLIQGRAQAQSTLAALESLVSRLAIVHAPKDVVLISGGFPFDTDLLPRYQQLSQDAANARVVIHALHVDQEAFDPSQTRPGETVFGGRSQTEGIATVASTTGGVFLSGVARATGAFDRLVTEIRASYQIGIDTPAEDADGKSHKVVVKVARDGASARYAEQVVVAQPARTLTSAALLDRALRQPADVADLPLGITTYTMHGEQSAARMLVSAEIGAPGSAPPVEWAVVVLQGDKVIVKSGGPIAAGPERPRVVSTPLDLPTGSYRVRVAAVDADGRTGTLETGAVIGFRAVTDARLSDLIVGVADRSQLEPRSHVSQSEDLTARLELSSAIDPATIKGELQLIKGGTAAPALTVPLAVRTPSTAPSSPSKDSAIPAISVLQATATIAGLLPGRYTASAVVQSGGQPLARVSRVIDITEGHAIANAPGAAAATDVAAAAPEPLAAGMGAEDVMRRVGAYVERYGTQASVIVSVERYKQQALEAAQAIDRPAQVSRRGANPVPSLSASAAIETKDRSLVSELALVRNQASIGGWAAYRDVFEADGKPVSDRHDRLRKLFEGEKPDLEAAKRITAESARFNVGTIRRTFNVPTAALFFFHPGNLSRFTFRRRGTERIDGVETWKIDFEETRKPSMIMTSDGRDIFASGSLWVNPADGSVVRTRLVVNGYLGTRTGADVDVVYRQDATLGMLMPVKMTERYRGLTSQISGEAVYSDFKRFRTSATVK